jgi:diguanylate cyclase (GGDEF)-like protein/putative nucleotidyltransferase with HDIG domain
LAQFAYLFVGLTGIALVSLGVPVVWAVLAVLGLAALMGALLAGRPGRASARIIEGAQRVAEGELSVRFDESSQYSELQPLARSLNTMMGALEQRAVVADTRQRELQALVNLSEVFLSSVEVRNTMKLALQEAIRAVGAESGAISLAENDGDQFQTLAVIGFPEEQFIDLKYPVDAHSAMGYAIMQRKTVASNDLSMETRFQATPNTRRAGVVSLMTSPMLLDSRVVGAITVCTFERHDFSQNEMDILQAVANHTAVAAERIKLVSDLSESYERTLTALVAALDARDRETEGHSKRVVAYSVALAESMGVDAALKEEIARGALLHDIGKIGVPDGILRKGGALSEEEWLTVRNHPELGRQILGGIGFLRGPAEIVYSHHEHWDGSGYPRGLRGQEIPLGARVFAVVDAFDAMTSYRPYRDPQTFQKARDEIRKGASTQFDPAVVEAFLKFNKDDWAALREQSQESNHNGARDMGSLRRISSGQLQATNVIVAAITSSLDIHEVYQRCVQTLTGVTRAKSAAIYSYKAETQELVFEAGAEIPAPLGAQVGPSLLARLLGGASIQQGITQFYAQLSTASEPMAQELSALQPEWGSALIIPLQEGERELGALALFSAADHAFNEDERNMFDHVAKQLGQAVVNARVHEKVRFQAITDALTGAYNRHYLDDFLNIEVKRCLRYKRPLSILMLDLDHFRACNERAGHQGGDKALQDVVSLMNIGVRSVDLVARYGGEEFTMVLPETDVAGAMEVAERIRKLIEQHSFPCGNMSASLGVASCEYKDDTPDAAALVGRADRALYRAKQNGRNQVILWQPELETA